jgi:hypothetical protein
MHIAKKEDLRNLIFARISEYDIFRMYLGKFKLGGAVKSPFMPDTHPSLLVYANNEGHIYYKDMRGGPYNGDCFNLVMQLYGLTFPQALNKVAHDFGIQENGEKWELLKREYKAPEIKKIEKLPFRIIERPFTLAELEWWNRYTISEDDLRRENIFSIRTAWINGKKIWIDKDELAFAYYFEDVDCWKYYFPHREKGRKWFCNLPNSYVEGLENLRGVKKGILTKSRKDRILLNKFVPAANTQNESESAFTEELVGFIEENVYTLFLNFDNDATGVENSKKITSMHGYKYINAPKYLLKQGITDFTDWCYADGIDPVLKYLKKRGVL